ncbi:MAG: DUF992 domain-containing protein [Alphaproteobacteria bacterium]|nr:DUF992 domain-containing protein [Alphaproteobacteria bacterium]
MNSTSRNVLAAMALAGTAFLFAVPANAAVKAGMLTCHVSSGWGFIFGSSKDLRCLFQPPEGAVEHYRGTINKFGVDIGYTQAGVIAWGVFAPSSSVHPGALSGHYVGASAQATAGVGLGANALVGGFRHSIMLQPLSIEGSTGLNVAAGIGSITLHYVPTRQ